MRILDLQPRHSINLNQCESEIQGNSLNFTDSQRLLLIEILSEISCENLGQKQLTLSLPESSNAQRSHEADSGDGLLAAVVIIATFFARVFSDSSDVCYAAVFSKLKVTRFQWCEWQRSRA